MTDPDQQRRSTGETGFSGPADSSSYLKARTALTVYQAQDKQLGIQKKKGTLVDRARAEALVFRLARQERDTWVTWPNRVAALMAAEVALGVEKQTGAPVIIEAAILQRVLEAHVRQHLDALADVLAGDVELGPYQTSVLSDEERRAGKVLACIAMPLTDVEVEYEPIELPGGLRPKTWRAKVVSMAQQRKIPLASHDDTTSDHVAMAVRDKVSVAEFPTTFEAAEALHAAGIRIMMGAPNVVRGGWHCGNIAAADLAGKSRRTRLERSPAIRSGHPAGSSLPRNGGQRPVLQRPVPEIAQPGPRQIRRHRLSEKGQRGSQCPPCLIRPQGGRPGLFGQLLAGGIGRHRQMRVTRRHVTEAALEPDLALSLLHI